MSVAARALLEMLSLACAAVTLGALVGIGIHLCGATGFARKPKEPCQRAMDMHHGINRSTDSLYPELPKGDE